MLVGESKQTCRPWRRDKALLCVVFGLGFAVYPPEGRKILDEVNESQLISVTTTVISSYRMDISVYRILIYDYSNKKNAGLEIHSNLNSKFQIPKML